MRSNSRLNAMGLAGMIVLWCLLVMTGPIRAEQTFTKNAVLGAAENLFGGTSESLATVVEKVFADLGEPNAYIAGEEFSGAIGVGLRYGRGDLNRKGTDGRKVFWQGPSVGFDLGADASKVFVLVYDLADTETLFKRYPAIDGSFYFVAGVGANYHRSNGVVLAPIRTGVGLRAGVNVGYLHYTREHSWVPL